MDVSHMSEEEQLKAAMELSMRDYGGSGVGGAGQALQQQQHGAATAPAPSPPDRARPRAFPGKDAQDALPPCPRPLPGNKKPRAGEPRAAGQSLGTEVRLSDAEISELLRLVFTGAGAREDERPSAQDAERWLNVGFQFSLLAGTEWGLWQRHGGPCGVFAPVQAYILRVLLFGEAADSDGAACAQRKEQPLACAGGDEGMRGAVLAHALACILYQATTASSYIVCQVEMTGASGEGADAEAAARSASASAIATGTGGIKVSGRRVPRVLDAQQLFEEAFDSWLAGPCGVLSFVCSVLLSRTLATVREDMDDPSMPLLGRFGHCSQELVNLMLVGEATSNVFDGTRFLGDDPSSGLLLKGVIGDRVGVPPIGFLSGFEAESTRKLEVGTLYKYPDFPVWVLGSATHYTVIFCARRTDSHLSQDAQVEQRAKQVFTENAFDEGGLALAMSLPAMLQALNIGADRADQARRDLVREDVILWQDFLAWTRRQFGCAAGPAAGQGAIARIKLFMYDGQDPPGPSVRSICLEVSDIDPRLAGGGAEGDDLVATLHTRWPNAVVQVAPLAGAGAEGLGGGVTSL